MGSGILVGVNSTPYNALVWGKKVWTSRKKVAYTVVLATKYTAIQTANDKSIHVISNALISPQLIFP